MSDSISWIATIATVLAASMTAANLGTRITGYGFCVFLAGSVAWFAVGLMTGQPALTWTNAVLTILNLFGIWRWLGRQAKVEQGANLASKASQATPGEALFPVSLLTRTEVRCGSHLVGHCVDAMAGSSSGTVNYVVVAQGGVAGIGEILRRMPWTAVRVDGNQLVSALTSDQFQKLEEVQRDKWPAR